MKAVLMRKLGDALDGNAQPVDTLVHAAAADDAPLSPTSIAISRARMSGNQSDHDGKLTAALGAAQSHAQPAAAAPHARSARLRALRLARCYVSRNECPKVRIADVDAPSHASRSSGVRQGCIPAKRSRGHGPFAEGWSKLVGWGLLSRKEEEHA